MGWHLRKTLLQAAARQFVEGEGPRLHAELEARAQKNSTYPFSYIEPAWCVLVGRFLSRFVNAVLVFRDDAYLRDRRPTAVNTNPFFLLKKSTFTDKTTSCTSAWLASSAH